MKGKIRKIEKIGKIKKIRSFLSELIRKGSVASMSILGVLGISYADDLDTDLLSSQRGIITGTFGSKSTLMYGVLTVDIFLILVAVATVKNPKIFLSFLGSIIFITVASALIASY